MGSDGNLVTKLACAATKPGKNEGPDSYSGHYDEYSQD
jgi:hypothetical protein